MCRNGHDESYRLPNGRCAECKSLNQAKRRKERKGSQEFTKREALRGARRRAKEQNLPCTLTRDNLPDVPELCPVLGIPLICGSGGFSPNSPSLDKIIPEYGYVPENVQWISNKANIIKRDYTPTDLLKAGFYFAKRVEKVFEDKKANIPPKGILWFMGWWDYYSNLKFKD